MPHLCGSLPFIDHATQMQMDLNTEIVVAVEVERVEETNPTTSEIESFMSKIHEFDPRINATHLIDNFDMFSLEY